MLLPERLAGAIYGHLVGDALGVPYEFTPADRSSRPSYGPGLRSSSQVHGPTLGHSWVDILPFVPK